MKNKNKFVNRFLQRDSQKPLTSFNVMRCYATLFFMPPSSLTSFKFIGTVLSKFFLFQYFRKINILHTPVKNVDHELDQKIPFKTEYLPTYMDFINFWIRCMSMLEKRFGLYKGTKLCAEFLKHLTNAYSQAYKIYSLCMTTTVQPDSEQKQIRALRKADPHYLCVPSLHIAIVCLTFSFYRMLFKRECFSESETQRWNYELYEQAVKIAESVLYVKQHSVNCIPSAMYMMTKIEPDLFTKEDALLFLGKMFTNDKDILEEDKTKIISYMQQMYINFLEEAKTKKDWKEPIINWLDNYQAYKE